MTKDNGLVQVSSGYSVDETLGWLEAAFADKGLEVFAVIDHSGEARKLGLKMPQTKVLIFGNPKAGTPLMQAEPHSAIDLPLKILIWEDGNGQVWVSYNSPAYLQERYGLSAELIKNVAVIETLASQTAQ